MSNVACRVTELIKGHIHAILLMWAVSIGLHHTFNIIEERELKRIERELASASFTDFMVYHSIDPASPTASIGSEARFKSDSEVIKPGFKIEWDEIIECDMNPFDDFVWFTHHRNVQVTSRVSHELRGRPSPEVYKKQKGFESIDAATGKAVKYPNHPADCRLNSAMTQYHAYGFEKRFQMVSGIVKIR